MNKNKLNNINKKIILIIGDVISVILSVSISYSLRLEKIVNFWEINIFVFIIFFTLFFIFFIYSNIYQILIRYFDYYSIIKIIKSLLIFQFFLIIINFIVYQYIYFPRSISFIAPIFIAIFTITYRIIINFFLKIKNNKTKQKDKSLILGINKSSVDLLNNIRQLSYENEVLGFIDINNEFKKREINGIKIYKKENLYKVIKELDINNLFIAPKILRKKKIEEIFDNLKDKNVRIINLEKFETNIPNFYRENLPKKLNFYDIVNRPKSNINQNLFIKEIKNQSILVTGGGGSIGSEICVQLFRFKPKTLYILDNSEINLFKTINKLKDLKKTFLTKIIPVLGDCSDKNFILNSFKKREIDLIFHAAAYKHVNFGEENIYSIIKNNIFGTREIIELSVKKNVKKFVFISSDKAVNPKSNLGYTKKIGEILTNDYYKFYSKKIKTSFTIVRFGNVIGSSGSVIPIFLDQLSKNKQLTLTHKKVQRYFMSVEEAVELVLQSSFMTKKGLKIFALDMGKQIKIFDIAKRIILLSGNTLKDSKNIKGDIPIKIIGLKKGEKLSEEITLGKNLVRTKHPKILLCEENLKNSNYKERIFNLEKNITIDRFNKKFLKQYLEAIS